MLQTAKKNKVRQEAERMASIRQLETSWMAARRLGRPEERFNVLISNMRSEKPPLLTAEDTVTISAGGSITRDVHLYKPADIDQAVAEHERRMTEEEKRLQKVRRQTIVAVPDIKPPAPIDRNGRLPDRPAVKEAEPREQKVVTIDPKPTPALTHMPLSKERREQALISVAKICEKTGFVTIGMAAMKFGVESGVIAKLFSWGKLQPADRVDGIPIFRPADVEATLKEAGHLTATDKASDQTEEVSQTSDQNKAADVKSVAGVSAMATHHARVRQACADGKHISLRLFCEEHKIGYNLFWNKVKAAGIEPEDKIGPIGIFLRSKLDGVFGKGAASAEPSRARSEDAIESTEPAAPSEPARTVVPETPEPAASTSPAALVPEAVPSPELETVTAANGHGASNGNGNGHETASGRLNLVDFLDQRKGVAEVTRAVKIALLLSRTSALEQLTPEEQVRFVLATAAKLSQYLEHTVSTDRANERLIKVTMILSEAREFHQLPEADKIAMVYGLAGIIPAAV